MQASIGNTYIRTPTPPHTPPKKYLLFHLNDFEGKY